MKTMRCAIYTRKSTEDGLDKEFNTLEAQRESGENYIKSQSYQGWEIIPTHYDDGGFSGGTLKRPALQQLLKDVEAGMVDMIVVYKIDRLICTTLTSYFATWLFCGGEKTGRFRRLIERLPVIMPSTRGIRIPRRIIC